MATVKPTTGSVSGDLYNVLNPKDLYRGKSYSSHATDWFNWLVSTDPDKHNNGPVVFLRANLMPNSVTGLDSSDMDSVSSIDNRATGTDAVGDSTAAYSDDQSYPRKYVNNPNVKVGADRLQIFTDQVIFCPIVTAYAEASRPYIDWAYMQEYTGVAIDYGDNPPDPSQLTINGQKLKINALNDYRIATPVFTAVIPDTDYGRSVKDYLEMPLAPGHYPIIVEGYFVMIQFRRASTYFVHSMASAPRETRGNYFAEFLYEIEVVRRPARRPMQGAPGFRHPRNQGIISKILAAKVKNGEITSGQATGIRNNMQKTYKGIRIR